MSAFDSFSFFNFLYTGLSISQRHQYSLSLWQHGIGIYKQSGWCII